MKPTTSGLLVALAAVCCSLGWSFVRLVQRWGAGIPDVGPSMPVTMALLALALLVWTLLSRPRLLRKPGHPPLAPTTAARTAALALSGSRVGAIITGVHLGLVIALLPQRTAPSGRAALIDAGVTVIGAVALAVIARWLESLCRIKSGDGDGTAATGHGKTGRAPNSAAGSAARDGVQ